MTPYRYWDKNGNEVKEGDTILLFGRKEKVYLLEDEESLGIDATNPIWVESGRAVPCEYGCYELSIEDMKQAELIK